MCPLNGIKIMLSAAPCDNIEDNFINHVAESAIRILAFKIFEAGWTIIFGCHPKITPLLLWAARECQTFKNEQLQPYLLRRFSGSGAQIVFEDKTKPQIHWIGRDGDVGEELSEMRKVMAFDAHVGIFIGGATKKFKGSKPGILEEYECFLSAQQFGPAYLLGAYHGKTKEIIQDLEKRGVNEPNGLSSSQLEIIHKSDDIEKIAEIIFQDIRNLFKI